MSWSSAAASSMPGAKATSSGHASRARRKPTTRKSSWPTASPTSKSAAPAPNPAARDASVPHALAAGLALLQPKKTSMAPVGGPDDSLSGSSRSTATTGGHRENPASVSTPSPKIKRLSRLLIEDAPANTTALELTVLLPLNLKDALAKDPVRIILESDSQPLDPQSSPIKPSLNGPSPSATPTTASSPPLESITGAANGINAIPTREASAPSSTPSAITRASGSAKSSASKSML